MTKIPAILSAALTATLVSCGPEDHTPVGQTFTAPLVTSDSTQAGTLSVFNSTDGLFITADAASGWELTGARLAVTKSLDCMPMTKSGNANTSRFLIRRSCKKAESQIQFALPLLVDPGTPLYIALRAEFQPIAPPSDHDGGHDCDERKTQMAWPVGTSFGGTDGAMFVVYTVQSASMPSLAGQYRTHSQEAWGSAQANDATNFLAGNFSADFIGGVTVGSQARFSARFTTVSAVSTFLPQAGTPSALLRNYSNPADVGNSFAGNTLALALNLGFSADLSFAPMPGVALGDLVVADPNSHLYGVAVKDLLSMANDLLGGMGQDLGITVDEANEAVMKVNANFENQGDQHFLGLP